MFFQMIILDITSSVEHLLHLLYADKHSEARLPRGFIIMAGLTNIKIIYSMLVEADTFVV